MLRSVFNFRSHVRVNCDTALAVLPLDKDFILLSLESNGLEMTFCYVVLFHNYKEGQKAFTLQLVSGNRDQRTDNG